MSQLTTILAIAKKPWCLVLFIMFLCISYNFVDIPVAIYSHSFDLEHNIIFFKMVSLFGIWQIYFCLFVFLILYFRYIDKNKEYENKSWYLFTCLMIPIVIALIIKITLSRARPELFFHSQIFGFHWFQLKDSYHSLPSGHAVTVMSLVVGLGTLFPKCVYYVLFLALLIGLSRIILDKHYVSDVLAGFYLGFLGAGLYTQYSKFRTINVLK